MNSSFIFSNYQFGVFASQFITQQGKLNEYTEQYNSRIRDFGLKIDFDYLSNQTHSIKFGLVGTQHQFSPSSIVVKNDNLGQFRRDVERIDATETGIYAEDTYSPFDKLKIYAGVRISTFTTPKINYFNPESRLALAYSAQNNLAFKASFATMNQYIHLLSNSGAVLTTDLWVPSTDKLPAQRSRQYAMGLAKDFDDKNLALTIEGYYKEMDNIIAYKEGASSLIKDGPEGLAQQKDKGISWDDQVTSGKGKSYGAEFLLQRKVGRFTGWVGYTLSWTKHQFNELNFGKEFWAKNDRRHDISVVGLYHLSSRITLSGTWVYDTENALTVPTAAFSGNFHNPGISPFGIPYSEGGNCMYNYFQEYPNFGERNNFRAEAFHRLDMSIQLRKTMKKRHERTWEFSIYNLYNRKNPYYYYSFTNTQSNDLKNPQNSTTTSSLTRYSLLGIIPAVSYNFKF